MVDVSDFFCSGVGEKEEASEEVAGGSVLIKNRGRGGGFSEEEAWEGKGRWGNVCGEGGGGLNIFFRARNSRQVNNQCATKPLLEAMKAPPLLESHVCLTKACPANDVVLGHLSFVACPVPFLSLKTHQKTRRCCLYHTLKKLVSL